MVDNQKVVVVLLLITIILSVLSVVLTLSINTPNQRVDLSNVKVSNLKDQVSTGNGQIQLTVEPPLAG